MIVNILRIVAVLVAAFLLGNWFQKDLRKAKIMGLPWYRPYLSPPGIIIIFSIILLPILVKFMR